MHTCSSCSGLIPEQNAVCPNCRKESMVGLLAKTALGGLISMTLMACYGAPPPNWKDAIESDKDKTACENGHEDGIAKHTDEENNKDSQEDL